MLEMLPAATVVEAWVSVLWEVEPLNLLFGVIVGWAESQMAYEKAGLRLMSFLYYYIIIIAQGFPNHMRTSMLSLNCRNGTSSASPCSFIDSRAYDSLLMNHVTCEFFLSTTMVIVSPGLSS